VEDVEDAREERLAAWKRRMNPVIVVAAILPIAVSLTDTGRNHPAVWLDIASWLVFLVDYVVHVRLRPGYPRSKAGVFDGTIVVLAMPWYLIPGLGAGRLMGLARLARLGRVYFVSPHSRKLRDLGRRLSHAALYSIALIASCAIVVEAVEPASSGFVHFREAAWWALVTFTTVGYGDFVPVTSAGRLAAALLMIGGIALIGSLAASLGSFLNKVEDVDAELQAANDGQLELLAEVRALRVEIAELRRLQTGEPPAE
jgi:voltage-gated potassium channel